MNLGGAGLSRRGRRKSLHREGGERKIKIPISLPSAPLPGARLATEAWGPSVQAGGDHLRTPKDDLEEWTSSATCVADTPAGSHPAPRPTSQKQWRDRVLFSKILQFNSEKHALQAQDARCDRICCKLPAGP